MEFSDSGRYTKLMLDSSPLAAHFWDEDLHMVDCNQAAVRMFGMPSKREYIDRYFELTPEFQPDGVRSIDKLRRLIDDTLETGLQKAEWMRQSVDGEPIPFELTLVRVECDDRNLIAGYCRDLREHRRMAVDIERRDTLLSAINRIAGLLLAADNEENFEGSLLEGMEIIGRCMDADFVQIWPNETLEGRLHFTLKYKWVSESGKKAPAVPVGTAVPYGERWLGLLPRGECVNGPVASLPAEDRELLAPLGITSTITVPLFYRDSFWGVFCVDDCVKERYFTEGEISLLYSAGLMMVNAIHRNRHAADMALQLAKLSLVVKATKIGLWDIEVASADPDDPESRYVWSGEFRHMLGYGDEADFPNVAPSWSDRIHPEDKDGVYEAFGAHLADRTGMTPYNIEYRMQKKDGAYAYFRDVGETIRGKDGTAIRVAGALLDVTANKALLNDLKTEKEAAQKANEAKTAFLANMSHEIRTPMNAILGMAEILEHEDLNHRQMGFVRDISSSAYSLLGIINDILDMSKIEAGKLELHPVDYSLNQFLDNVVSMFTHVAGSKGLEFIFETVGEMPDYLYGDDIRLRQVVTNICGNAVKFTEEGQVRLSVSATDGTLTFRIEDTGPGIRKEDIPTLFNAFEQADKAKNRSVVGTGLGLPICKSFIEMMGGHITVTSEYGLGAEFAVTLPIVKGNPDNIRVAETFATDQDITAPDAKVLITDDNEFNLKVACGLLSLMDIKAETAESGARSIEMVTERDYDIVFMDHMMPEMDGVETVQRIRAMGGRYERLIIIALTANAVKGAREMFIENGFDDFLAKPVDTDELREMLRKYLPPGKVRSEGRNDSLQYTMEKKAEIRRKSILSFVRENRQTFDKVAMALDSGDVKTAHRIAHTLKSVAGYLGKKRLQQAALLLEEALKGGSADHTPKMLETLERELSSALREFEPLVREAEAKRPPALPMEGEALAALLEELRPLLAKGDFAATEYVDRLERIQGMESVAERIDDYDFSGALRLIEAM